MFAMGKKYAQMEQVFTVYDKSFSGMFSCENGDSDHWVRLTNKQETISNNTGMMMNSVNLGLSREVKMINDKKLLENLFVCFPDGFINSNLEFIAIPKTNLYFNLGNCETEIDVKCKILEWFSRDAYKSMPFRSNWRNEQYNNSVLFAINKFFGTSFTTEEMGEIYGKLGNAIRHSKTIEFVQSGYDFGLLRY